jgi:peptidoglycan hydrolase-like protein with peptidoglycan-binding domain
MKQNRPVFSVLMLTGLLGLSASPVWSQDKPADVTTPGAPGGGERELGSPTGKGGGMKSGDTAREKGAGDESLASTKQGQWSQDEVKTVQEALKGKGNDPGPVDGIMGPQTQKAIREFQQASGLKTTGRLDAETATALGVKSGSAPMKKGSSSTEREPSSKGPSNTPMGNEAYPKNK